MDNLWQILDGPTSSSTIFSPQSVLLSLIVAFVLGQLLAWVYYYTHSGLSYSKSFVQALILITIVVAMVMSTIGHSFVAAVGLMGALSIIRFRNMIKDTRDIAFIFCSLVVGMAAGSQRFAIAIIGTIVLSLIAIYLHLSDFGMHQPHNGFLRFTMTEHIGPDHPLPNVLKLFCGKHTLISAQTHDYGDLTVEYAYQIMIRNAAKNVNLLAELEKIKGIKNISLTMQEQLLEV